ncbi:hypothetical protein E4K10_19865 [Streptomyces sp. T1317-0309]|nr:hypothetical protein E4K10_19865 [Streptomyces sp. T1317-0309]
MSVGGRRPAEGDVIERLKRLRARYEPAVTRILLLGFFVTGLVAQFVKPVGHRPGTGSPGTQSPVERPFLCDLTARAEEFAPRWRAGDGRARHRG